MSRKDRIVEAVNYLIASPDYAKLIKEIRGIISDWACHPMAYDGHLSHLNALVDTGLSNPAAFDKLIDLVERKRRLIPEVKKVDYQRNLMQERRERMRKALALHTKLKGTLTPEQRKAHIAETQARWAKAKDDFLKARGELTWKERNAVTQEFWATIDATLDKNLGD